MLKILKTITNKKNNKLVNIINKNNLIIICINEECDLNKYYDSAISEYKSFRELLLPIRMYLTDKSYSKIKKQFIWYEKKDNNWLIVSKNNDECKISFSEFSDEFIDEVQLTVKDNNYKITKYIHDSNLKSRFMKWYPEPNNDIADCFCLHRNEAHLYVRFLIDKLERAKIFSDIDISKLYRIVNIDKLDEHTNENSDKTTKTLIKTI